MRSTWLVLAAMTAGCGFELDVEVVRPHGASFFVDGEEVTSYRETFHFWSFQSALEDPATLRVWMGDSRRDITLGVGTCAGLEEGDPDWMRVSYILDEVEGETVAGESGATCLRTFDFGESTHVIVD